MAVSSSTSSTFHFLLIGVSLGKQQICQGASKYDFFGDINWLADFSVNFVDVY
jgi:hypothetical protein